MTIVDDHFCTYMLVLCGGCDHNSAGLDGGFAQSIYFKHLKSIELMANGKYDEAFSLLSEVLRADEDIPRPVLYSVFSDLEKCCKEREDFKGAYEYSNNRIQLFEKMLSEA